ncbi:hypothetical protein NFB44_12025 [Yersinia ruckeri]|uniref:hypothetical protein n=1 Tax=Yersinia ruckeri TaxID=29486 RepID=UPI0022370175|nr:hypothetical protein [Yersinia ruckeri]MCW6556103.1 hypothetical protein [Yersinia ruckeri]UZX74429.1 hypothetical protein ND012_12280 [Yersinia ruckeri]
MKKVIKLAITVLGLIATVCTIFFALYPRAPDPQRHDDIVGNWRTKYSYSGQGVTFRLDGVTSYFSNGIYNFHGITSIEGGNSTGKVLISYITDGAGSWDLFDQELIITQNSLKTIPNKLSFNGQNLNPQQVEKIVHEELPALEKGMANGKSQSYKILSNGHDIKLLEVINTVGENFNITLYRDN